MEKYIHLFLKKLTQIMEFVIATLLACGIIIMIVQLIGTVQHLPDLNTYPNYDDLLNSCFNLIIGVELIRMLYMHTPLSVIEVLLFAIARQIIIDHSSPVNSLLGVIAIAILFATRKFLFSPFDETDKTTFRASQRVVRINHLFHLNIPFEKPEDTLLDVLMRRLEEEGSEAGTGTCVYFSDLGLRVAKITDGKITRIVVIRSIH